MTYVEDHQLNEYDLHRLACPLAGKIGHEECGLCSHKYPKPYCPYCGYGTVQNHLFLTILTKFA